MVSSTRINEGCDSAPVTSRHYRATVLEEKTDNITMAMKRCNNRHVSTAVPLLTKRICTSSLDAKYATKAPHFKLSVIIIMSIVPLGT
jgi:hypothetical protein